MRRWNAVSFGGLAAAIVAAVLAGPALIQRQEAVPEASAVSTPADRAENEDELVAHLAAGRAVIGGIEFTGATDTLAPSAHAVIVQLAGALRRTPGTFLIEAHVRPSGDVLADQSLTDRRAVVVRARLVEAGVSAALLFAMGFGGTRTTDTQRQARIELSRMP